MDFCEKFKSKDWRDKAVFNSLLVTGLLLGGMATLRLFTKWKKQFWVQEHRDEHLHDSLLQFLAATSFWAVCIWRSRKRHGSWLHQRMNSLNAQSSFVKCLNRGISALLAKTTSVIQFTKHHSYLVNIRCSSSLLKLSTVACNVLKWDVRQSVCPEKCQVWHSLMQGWIATASA